MKSSTVFDGQRGVIISIFIASVFINILILTAPLYMLQLFSRVISSGSTSTLIVLTFGAAIALVFYFLFDTIRQKLIGRLGTRLEARLGPVILTGMLTGSVPNELRGSEPLRDLQEVRGFVTSPVFTALLDAPWSILFVALIFLFNFWLGVVAVIGLTILFGLGVISEITGREPEKDATKAASTANASVAEMMQNAEVIHAMGKGRAQVERWTLNSFSALMFNTVVTDRVAFVSSLAKFVRMALQIAILCTGVLLVMRGELAAGLMIAASILLGRAAAPIEQSIAGWRSLLKARQARDRLNLLLAAVRQGDDRMELPEPEGRLSVENATVVLAGRQEPLLLDVSFKLEPGMSLGLIGPSGAGKTTLARTLVGLQPLVRGYVRIDDAALTDWPTEQIGQYVGFLPQRVELFDGTVAENIALMDPQARPSDIVAAAKLAEVHDLILTFPGGYNSKVGPRGEFLSAGQRQRIGLARAFFGNRRLIVLDEPNANLDPEGEEALARAIEKATAAGSVVVIVTHRMNLLRRVSHAALMQNGRLERFGEAKAVMQTLTQPLPAASKDDPKIAPFRRRDEGADGPDDQPASEGGQSA
jgi:PrtD family type I secretion system ABC transporter